MFEGRALVLFEEAVLADLHNWTGVSRPERKLLEGAYVRLKPLDPEWHSVELYEAAAAPDAEERFRYLYEMPPPDLEDLKDWAEKVSVGRDPLVFAIIYRKTGRAEERQFFMRIDSEWPQLQPGYEGWLSAGTFDVAGGQLSRLTFDR